MFFRFFRLLKFSAHLTWVLVGSSWYFSSYFIPIKCFPRTTFFSFRFSLFCQCTMYMDGFWNSIIYYNLHNKISSVDLPLCFQRFFIALRTTLNFRLEGNLIFEEIISNSFGVETPSLDISFTKLRKFTQLQKSIMIFFIVWAFQHIENRWWKLSPDFV